jgi:hypothetical protein
VYPNPAFDACLIAIKDNHQRIITVGIYNSKGQLVRNYSGVNSSELRIERGLLKSGNYIIRIDLSDGKSYTEKIYFK